MSEKNGEDVESGRPRTRISHLTMLLDQGVLTPEITDHHYDGSGTEDDPFVVTWIEKDPRNPLLFPTWYKWIAAITAAFATLAVSLCSSLYTGGIPSLEREFGASEEVITLGLSLFVLGFAIGPLFWAPMSELFGRQILYITTFGAFVAFNAGTTGAQNIWTIIILRFFAGSFGSSPLTNAGGVVADLFNAKERGLAMSIFSVSTFPSASLAVVNMPWSPFPYSAACHVCMDSFIRAQRLIRNRRLPLWAQSLAPSSVASWVKQEGGAGQKA